MYRTHQDAGTSPSGLSATELQQLQAIRAALPAVEQSVYLNTGSSGPLPTPAVEALIEYTQHDYHYGRVRPSDNQQFDQALGRLRTTFARVLGADPDEIALTHNTSEGINIATWGLNWQRGDELVVTTCEHKGVLLPAYALAQRQGVDVRIVDLDDHHDPAAMLRALDQAITARTRLIGISQVLWNSGCHLPLAAIVELAHRRGVLVLVDGAQSAGAVPVDLHALGVDFYAVPGQKWLCGPKGVGALYVRRDRISLLRPMFVGFASLRDLQSWSFHGDFLLADGAQRYESATVFHPGIYGMLASLQWLEHDVGLEWAHSRIQRMVRRARGWLQDIPGLTIHTPAQHGGLLVFEIAGLDAGAVVTALAEQQIFVRTVPLHGRHMIRLSISFYTGDNDLIALQQALLGLIEQRALRL
ncbi:MAG TPA: aminotransferase class V-fold PLP-dependent enzyme [Herpetosiphonaceae bacterium]